MEASVASNRQGPSVALRTFCENSPHASSSAIQPINPMFGETGNRRSRLAGPAGPDRFGPRSIFGGIV
jgi:hypothetical protein